MEDKPLLSNDSTQQQTVTKVIIPCTVCGAPSRGSVYGAIVCEPCKGFFKRNVAYGLDAFKCHYDSHCEININTRHTCTYCRLTKCFANGMQKDLLRAPRSKTNNKRKTIDSEMQIIPTSRIRLNDFAQIPTLNLLRGDQSTLTVDQWNLLSNLSHCYDDHAGLSIGGQYMSEQSNLPAKLRFKSTSVTQLYRMTLDATQSLYKNNEDFLSLSTDDRSILLDGTLMLTASISSSFIAYKIRLMENPSYYDAVEIMSCALVASITRHLPHQLYFDIIVMKLFLAILSFSTIRCTVYTNNSLGNFSNIQEILRIQNTYTELAWLYLQYKYGHEQAVKFFSDFIRCIFSINEILVVTHTVPWFRKAMDSIAEKTAQTFSLTD